MKPYKYILGLTLLFGLTLATADTPPPSTVTAKIKDSSGNAINATAGSLNVNVTNPGGGTTTVNQGTPNAGGAAAWFAQITNFPATQPVSQVGSWTVTQGSPPWSFNLNQLNGASPSVTNYLPSRITNGTSFVDPTQIRALNSGTDSVTVTGTIATSPTATSDATASGTMGSSGATVVVSASGIADGAVNIVGAFVGSIQIQCLAYGGSNTSNLSTLQSGLWSSAAITAPGFYKFRGANGCQSVQAAYSAYTSGSPVVSLAVNQAVGNPVVSQSNAANLKTASWLNDGAGNAVTSQVSGSQRPLDASILVGGSIVDPRQRNWSLNSVGDSVSAVVTNFPATQPVSGTVTANQGGAWSVTANAGTNLNTSLLALDTSVNGILQSQGSTTSGQKGPLIQGAVSISAPSYTTAQTSPLSLTTSGALRVDASASTQPVSGTVAATQSGAWNIGNITGTVSLPTNASTAANQATEIASLATIATNTGAQAQDFQSSGTITATNGTVSITGQGVYTATFSITGIWSASLVVEGQTQDLNWIQVPVNIISSTLPYQQTSGAITTNGVYSVTGGGFINIRARASSYTSGTVAVGIDGSLSQQTVIANITTPDLSITGASAQTAIVNNILGATSGTAATYAAGFHSANVQVVSTGTGGAFIFEGSNDNVNFQTIPVYSQLIATGTPITAAITATASQLIYTFPVTTNYIRLRIVTAITGGSIQAFTKLSQTTWSPAFFQVAQATAANLQTTATIASGTVTTVSTVTSVATDNIGANVTVADRASSASTTTFTSGAIVPASGQISYSVQVAATLVSGTAPTMDCVINESLDTGTTWFTVYSFERISAVTTLQSPMIRMTGNRIQYVCTIAGTTPSFTFSINRVGSNVSAGQARRFFDRALAPNTASSATGTWLVEGCNSAQVTYSQSAQSTNPTLTIQTSEDSSNWANTTYTIVPTGVGTFTTMVPQISTKFARLFVTNAGTGVTYTYSAFRCSGP